MARKPVAGAGSSAYRQAVARWLRAAMRDERGAAKITGSANGSGYVSAVVDLTRQ